MDMLAQLEALASDLATAPSDFGENLPEEDCIERWKLLFGYTNVEVVKQIQEHRSDLNRRRIPHEHWELVQDGTQMHPRHDKESYEHLLHLQSVKIRSSRSKVRIQKTPPKQTFILKLEGQLSTPEIVREIVGLKETPHVQLTTTDSESNGTFVVINGAIKDTLMRKFAHEVFQPFIQRYSRAEKDLSSTSLYPILGIDTTMPQFRISGVPSPPQGQYPIYYFFYGTLGKPARLARLLDLPEEPVLNRANVNGGVIKVWAGKYNALVDGPTTGCVEGWAYEVKNKEHEDALLHYETDVYEVVRCKIDICGVEQLVDGLTFRFIGEVGCG
jgi:hypothetical protein